MGKDRREAIQGWRNGFPCSPVPAAQDVGIPLAMRLCAEGPQSGSEDSGLPSQEPCLSVVSVQCPLSSAGDGVMLESSQIIGHSGIRANTPNLLLIDSIGTTLLPTEKKCYVKSKRTPNCMFHLLLARSLTAIASTEYPSWSPLCWL